MLVANLENHPYCHVTGIQVVETSYFFWYRYEEGRITKYNLAFKLNITIAYVCFSCSLAIISVSETVV